MSSILVPRKMSWYITMLPDNSRKTRSLNFTSLFFCWFCQFCLFIFKGIVVPQTVRVSGRSFNYSVSKGILVMEVSRSSRVVAEVCDPCLLARHKVTICLFSVWLHFFASIILIKFWRYNKVNLATSAFGQTLADFTRNVKQVEQVFYGHSPRVKPC